MDKELISGSYTCVKDAKCLDFWVALGVPENEAKAFVGTHWKLEIGFDGNTPWSKLECDEFPLLNLDLSGAVEGRVFTIPDKGFGKTSMVFTSIIGQSNKVHVISRPEKFGAHEVIETYSGRGIKMEYISKDKGVCYVETWSRVVNVTGSFRLKRAENWELFTKDFPMCPKIDEAYKLNIFLSRYGDTIHIVDKFGDGTVLRTAWKYDVETTLFDCSMRMTKIPGGNKIISINKAGNIQEYTNKFTADGFVQTLLDKETGQTGLMEFVRFVDFTGEFKPITNEGGDDIAVAIGCPVVIYQKIFTDPTTRMIIKESGGHYVIDFISGSAPKEAKGETVFTLGEEFEFKNPFDPTDKLKMVATAKDNVLLGVGKGKRTWKWKYIFTENFVIRENEIVGAGATEKVIFLRC